jgi:hypothetical protein
MILILFLLLLRFPTCIFSSAYATKILYVFLVLSHVMHNALSACLVVIHGEEYKLSLVTVYLFLFVRYFIVLSI